MVDMTKTTTEKKLTPSDIRGVFLRSNLFQGSWNFERMLMRRAINESEPRDKCGLISLSNTAS